MQESKPVRAKFGNLFSVHVELSTRCVVRVKSCPDSKQWNYSSGHECDIPQHIEERSAIF